MIETNLWGVLNEENCPNASLIPRKILDPLRNVPNGLGTHLCGQLTYVSPVRGKRAVNTDILEPVIKGQAPEVIICQDTEVLWANLFNPEPENHELSNNTAITLINKYPAGFRCADNYVQELMINHPLPKNEWYNFMPCLTTYAVKYPNELKTLDNARLRNQITGDYFQEIELTPLNQLEALLNSMKAGINAYLTKTSSMGIKQALIYPFINQGTLAGGTIKRLHSQTYIELTQSGHDIDYEQLLLSFYNKQCPLCQSTHDDRFVYENDSFTLWVTQAPSRNYQLRFSTKNHKPQFNELNNKEVKDLAELLKTANTLLTNIGVTSHRNIIFNTLHQGYETQFHFFGDIIPHEPVGGFELMGRLRVARVNPNEVASNLKEKLSELILSDYAYN